MAIYVDKLRDYGWKLRGRRVWNCHLIADSVPELITFATEELGMRAEWFQSGRNPHFDLTPARRRLAVERGAVELSRREFILTLRRIR